MERDVGDQELSSCAHVLSSALDNQNQVVIVVQNSTKVGWWESRLRE